MSKHDYVPPRDRLPKPVATNCDPGDETDGRGYSQEDIEWAKKHLEQKAQVQEKGQEWPELPEALRELKDTANWGWPFFEPPENWGGTDPNVTNYLALSVNALLAHARVVQGRIDELSEIARTVWARLDQVEQAVQQWQETP